MSPESIRQIWARAQRRCEYCHVPDIYEAGMHVDHIIAVKHAGESLLDNLALACVHCNRHKGPNIAGVDANGDIIRLFHPRKDDWGQHFHWEGSELTGRTQIGHVTIQVLKINEAGFRAMRAALMEERHYDWE